MRSLASSPPHTQLFKWMFSPLLSFLLACLFQALSFSHTHARRMLGEVDSSPSSERLLPNSGGGEKIIELWREEKESRTVSLGFCVNVQNQVHTMMVLNRPIVEMDLVPGGWSEGGRIFLVLFIGWEVGYHGGREGEREICVQASIDYSCSGFMLHRGRKMKVGGRKEYKEWIDALEQSDSSCHQPSSQQSSTEQIFQHHTFAPLKLLNNFNKHLSL